MAEMKDSGIEWIGKIPEEWSNIKLKSFYDFEKGKNAQLYTAEYIGKHEGQYPVFSGQTENNGVMGFIDTYDYELNECLFTTTVGAKVMTPKLLKGKFSLSQNCLIMKPKKECNNHFFFYCLISLFDYEKGAIPSYMQPSLRIDDLKKYGFYIPDLENQNRIADFLDKKCAEIDTLYSDIEKQIHILEEYKKSIITEAVTKGLDPDVEMKDSGISYIENIPKHWKVTNLKYLGKCQNGISKGGEYFGIGFPFVSYGDVYKNYSIPQNVDGLIMSTKTEQNIYSVKYGDVFFTRTSETIEEIGFASTCLKSIDNSVFAGFLIRFRPTSNDLIPEFSKFYFRSNIHRKFFVKEMNLVTRASLSQNLLGRLPVLLPPLCEQQMIAKNLEKKCAEIDGAIEEKKEQLETLEQYKKSLIYEYVTGKKEVK